MCRRLRELRAANCGSLSLGDSELHCPALEEVNLFGNRQLDADGRVQAPAAASRLCADSSRASHAVHLLCMSCCASSPAIHIRCCRAGGLNRSAVQVCHSRSVGLHWLIAPAAARGNDAADSQVRAAGCFQHPRLPAPLSTCEILGLIAYAFSTSAAAASRGVACCGKCCWQAPP